MFRRDSPGSSNFAQLTSAGQALLVDPTPRLPWLARGNRKAILPPMRDSASAAATLLLLAACSAPPPAATPRAAQPATEHLGFEQARAMFAARGVQPGQPLPKLSLVNLQGAPADLDALRGGQPLVLVTCSLTCNVARRQQANIDALRLRLRDRAAVVMVYTIDAHPVTDPCPYTGKEWVPPDNASDGVLVRQPTTLAERLALARRYADGWAKDTTVLVDTTDDASWRALGEAPNVGLLVGADGVVRERCGWFDAAAIERALAPDATDRR